MKAYQCDRCGGLYTGREFPMIRTKVSLCDGYSTNKVDLCNNCQRQLNDWWDTGKETEEEDDE